MKPRFKTIAVTAGVAVALGLAVTVGYLAAGTASDSAMRAVTTSAYDGSTKDSAVGAAPEAMSGSVASGEQNALDQSAPSATPKPTDTATSLVIMSASMALRVADLDGAVTSVRRIASSTGSQISNLSVYAGEPSPSPVPLADRATGSETSGPGTADITLRVPAAKLAAVEKAVAELGTVLTQATAEDDVTQQHIDLAARLKNLRAEEARLRSFLDDAKKVSEMLEVERELSRVRGEIESMQAQLTYLEHQAAMATLTISLSEPGPVVSPGTPGWGFTEAVTRGVRTAAALIGATISVLIAVVPLLVLAAIILLARRFIRRRRKSDASDTDSPSS